MTFVPTEGSGCGMWDWTRVSSANDEDPGSSSWLIMRGNHGPMAISPSCGLASLTWNHIVWLKRLNTNEHASAKHHFANFCSVTITITVNNQNSNPILATTSKQTYSQTGISGFGHLQNQKQTTPHVSQRLRHRKAHFHASPAS
jgi:hypothetical protein